MKLIITLFMMISLVFAQNTAKILENLKSEKDTSLLSRKCGTSLMMEIKLHPEKFEKHLGSELKGILSRPTLSTSQISANGKIRVHYDISGTNFPNYNLDEFLLSVDSVYQAEIENFGYPFPPSDNGEGGDNLYDVYIVNLGSQYYGYTSPESELENKKWTSFITINSDYDDFPTTGINAAKVTFAHEFHHAIQIGNYINRYSTESFYYEITSTAMEEFVFPQINDYWNYLDSYFRNTNLTFSRYSGYELAIWNIYLEKKFNQNLLKRTWELMPNYSALESINLALEENGSNFGTELYDFGEWVFFTNHRVKENEYFTDGKNYPKLELSLPLIENYTYQFDIHSLTNSYYLSKINQNEIIDSVILQISNIDIASALISSFVTAEISLAIFNSQQGKFEINDLYSYDLTAESESNFIGKSFINNELSKNCIPQYYVDFVYPQPFRTSDILLFFPIPQTELNEIRLQIIDISFSKVFDGKISINKTTNRAFWNGILSNGKRIPSGVFLYVFVNENNDVKKGKFAVINE